MKAKRIPIEYEEVGDIELPEDEAAVINQQIEAAEQELQEARVHFRWGTKQVVMVKKVAAQMGVPYQTYIKQVVFRQALQDLKELQEAESQALKHA